MNIFQLSPLNFSPFNWGQVRQKILACRGLEKRHKLMISCFTVAEKNMIVVFFCKKLLKIMLTLIFPRNLSIWSIFIVAYKSFTSLYLVKPYSNTRTYEILVFVSVPMFFDCLFWNTFF